MKMVMDWRFHGGYRMIRKPELLAPAGNLEKMKMALLYGADAVYLGGKAFGLRAFGGNFSREELQEGIAFAHACQTQEIQ